MPLGSTADFPTSHKFMAFGFKPKSGLTKFLPCLWSSTKLVDKILIILFRFYYFPKGRCVQRTAIDLHKIMNAHGSFVYPEFWSYPPYFTLQPIPETQNKQKQLWRALILAYCKHHRIFQVDVQEFPPFSNPAINRKFSDLILFGIVLYVFLFHVYTCNETHAVLSPMPTFLTTNGTPPRCIHFWHRPPVSKFQACSTRRFGEKQPGTVVGP